MFAFSVRVGRDDPYVDRGQLERMVADGLTVRQIAATAGKGYSTVLTGSGSTTWKRCIAAQDERRV